MDHFLINDDSPTSADRTVARSAGHVSFPAGKGAPTEPAFQFLPRRQVEEILGPVAGVEASLRLVGHDDEALIVVTVVDSKTKQVLCHFPIKRCP